MCIDNIALSQHTDKRFLLRLLSCLLLSRCIIGVKSTNFARKFKLNGGWICHPHCFVNTRNRTLFSYGTGIIPINCLLSPKGDACWYDLFILFDCLYCLYRSKRKLLSQTSSLHFFAFSIQTLIALQIELLSEYFCNLFKMQKAPGQFISCNHSNNSTK